ncbi:MAG: hypothetical protein EOO39_14500 [Cytophagaceae bacterium]|nr:MAG: hypothetical protein EOO39_14500 [Cytophagaceae bacterium]
MRTSYKEFGLRVLVWSLLSAFILDRFTTSLNPFLGSIVMFLILLLVGIQLFLLRKRGLAYVALFFLCLCILTYAFQYVDDAIFDFPRRYYSIY